ncbi:hypothetical protein [Streptomyces sp. NPDC021356]|uniref:hypothetical protein n=1 Tax=Streptomyces sp. NPDC021356 TaxID=3154900 RepID=UPI0033D5D47B
MSDTMSGTPSGTLSGTARLRGPGRLVAGLAWAVLLLGLWQWGGAAADGHGRPAEPATGDMAAVGRPAQDDPSPHPVHLSRTGP